MTGEPDFRREQRAVAIAMACAFATALAVLGVAAMMDRATSAAPFAERLQSTIKADLIVIVWLAAAIANVARLRFFSADDIGGSSSEIATAKVRRANAILQNTLEQACLAIVTHLIVTATLDRSVVLVEALAALFAAGRLLFWWGYSRGARGRAFGFALTFYPSLIALVSVALVGVL